MTLVRIAIGLAIILGIALIIKATSAPGAAPDNIAHALWAGMAITLVGSGVLHHYAGSGSQAVMHLLIWLAILAVVAFAYQYKSALGL